MATRKAIVLAAAYMIIDEFTEGLEVVDLLESIMQTRNSDDSS